MTPIEKQCQEAMARIVRWLNLSCPQHKLALRDGRKLPRFEHDCDCCVYLGELGDYDLWVHPTGAKTVIARWGNDGPDYKSGLGAVGRDIELTAAYNRSVERGFRVLA